MLQVQCSFLEIIMKLRWQYLGLVTPFLATAYAACTSAGGGGTGGPGNVSATGGKGGFQVGNTGGAGFIVSDAGSQFESIEPACAANCTDFPAQAINTEGIDPNLFAGASSGSGPCIIEPQDGTMFPRNWLRPRVSFHKLSAGLKYQLRFHADREANDLVVYTSKIPWAMPKDIWHALATNVMEEDITLTVRASNGGESSVKFRIAPAEAGGTIVFWHATQCDADENDKSALYGFKPGDEGVVNALRPAQISTRMMGASGNLTTENSRSKAGSAICVGCHASTPDGKAVTVTDDWPWNVALANIDPTAGAVGSLPSFVTPAGMTMANTSWQGVTSFSRDDWFVAGKRRYVGSWAPRRASTDPSLVWEIWGGNASETMTKTGQDDLIWVNLASNAAVPAPVINGNSVSNTNEIFPALVRAQGDLWGIIERTGDTRGAVTPSWSHNGQTVAYTSTDSTSDGRIGPNPKSNTPPLTAADIYTVPFNNGSGGPATPVSGAAEPNFGEYYPAFSGDDAYIAYNRAPMDGNALYYRPDSEIFIVPAAGGAPERVIANDPPQCTGLDTSTLHNSWPKWSPYPKEANGAKYYFLTFSSSRYSNFVITKAQGSCSNDVPGSDLYLAMVKVKDGVVTTYPGIYLWNQAYLFATDESGNPVTDANGKPTYSTEPGLNVTPAWDEFVVPTVPDIQVIIN
jgi:hypothetical protein